MMVYLDFLHNSLHYSGLAIPTKKFLLSGHICEYHIFLNGNDCGRIFGIGNSWGSEEDLMAQQMIQTVGNIIFEKRQLPAVSIQ